MGGLRFGGPTLDESWKSDLERWLTPFIGALRHKTRARTCPVYVAGLIGAGDRKSMQPMAARDGDVGYDQLHHFIASSVWDAAPLEYLAQGDLGDETANRLWAVYHRLPHKCGNRPWARVVVNVEPRVKAFLEAHR